MRRGYGEALAPPVWLAAHITDTHWLHHLPVGRTKPINPATVAGYLADAANSGAQWCGYMVPDTDASPQVAVCTRMCVRPLPAAPAGLPLDWERAAAESALTAAAAESIAEAIMAHGQGGLGAVKRALPTGEPGTMRRP